MPARSPSSSSTSDRAFIRMDVDLHRRLKILATLKGLPLYDVLNQAASRFIQSEEAQLQITLWEPRSHSKSTVRTTAKR